MRQLPIAVAALVLLPSLARADFMLQSPAPAASAARFSEPQAPVANRQRLRRVIRTASATVPLAEGFGKEIPLRIAVEQILPPSVRAQYGAGVDPEQTVDWVGGRPWPEVLRGLIRPLHLRAAVSPKVVRIETTND